MSRSGPSRGPPERVVTPFAEPIGRRGEALAVRRGDQEFLAYLNIWVDARGSDGWLDARASEWFGRLDWAEAEPKP